MKRIFCSIILILITITLTACSKNMPDKIFYNGKIYSLDEKNSIYEAVAVKNGLIFDLGSSQDLLNKYPNAERIDLKGNFVFPGFIDAHGHITGYGENLLQIDLVGTTSQKQIAELVRQKSKELKEGEWILGVGWDQNDWEDKSWPNHKILDQAAPKNPVALTRIDGHALWVNKRALELAGITKETPNPEGGEIKKDNYGNPTGLLIDNAMNLVYKVIPPPTEEDLIKTVLTSTNKLVEYGITSVHDMGVGERTIQVYKKLADEGKLPLRIHVYVDGIGETWKKYLNEGKLVGYANNFVNVDGIKLFVDGAMGSRGALMSEPYHDDPGNYGLLLLSEDEIYKVAKDALNKGLQVATHAIGDSGNFLVLNAYERAFKELKPKEHRFRIEHVQVINPNDAKRLADLKVIPSMQPVHATSDMYWAEARLGPERVKWSYALRMVLNESKIIAGGSDFPVENPSVLEGIYAAITRQDKNGHPKNAQDVLELVKNKKWVLSKEGIKNPVSFENGWYPDQKLTIDEAIKCFTKWAAYAVFEENKKGTIEIGKWADFSIVDKDLYNILPEEILRTNVMMTVVNGKIVYKKDY
ncbi:MAG: amidohydrolase [Ignavibacteria bacterium]|nr:amidohydrolase [Ignavibacteria bacterium]